jgi:catechol 2,3-dioxygenase-like lactoylglutathione lyase family enzyme
MLLTLAPRSVGVVINSGLDRPAGGGARMLRDCRVHTTLPVSDMARARAFYAERLGLEPVLELPTGVFYACGEGTRFALSPMAARPAGHTQMGFVVRDLAAEVKQLKARGVVFDEYDLPGLKTVDSIADRGALKAAWFKDSEGNTIGLMQPVTVTAAATTAQRDA